MMKRLIKIIFGLFKCPKCGAYYDPTYNRSCPECGA